MAEPASTVIPVAVISGASAVAVANGLDTYAVVAAFFGSMMFSFLSKGTPIPVRIGLTACAWVFGYIAGTEIVKRHLWGFDSAAFPSYIAAFFCVAVFKILLLVLNEDGRTWVRKQLGITTEGSKGE